MLSVVIPWRTDSGHRERLMQWTTDRWRKLYEREDIEVLLSDSGDKTFSRGKSRNYGARISIGDVIVVADADTVPMKNSVDEAVEIARTGRWCLAYEEGKYYNLAEGPSEVLLASPSDVDIEEPIEGSYEHKLTSWAGMLVVPRDAFDVHGGYDERFVGWGWEDNAFQKTLDRRYGKHKRASGFVVHLWHPVSEGFNTPEELANRELFHREYR